MGLNENTGTESLEDLLYTYSLTEKVSFGDTLDIDNKKIVIPHGYKHFKGLVGIGAIYTFMGLKNIKDISDIDKYKNDLLIENELKQLKTIFKYLQSYKNSQNNFGNTSDIISVFLDELGKTISSNSSLWSFIKNTLEERNISSNFESFIQEYLSYKSIFLEEQKNCDLCDNDLLGEGNEDNDSYNEHYGIDKKEQMPGEDKGVFGTIEPGIKSKYFSESILEDFDHLQGKFIKADEEKTKLEKQEIFLVKSIYKFSGKKGKVYNLPIDRNILDIYSWDETEVEIYRDNYGNFTLKFLKDCTTNIGIGYGDYKNNFSSDKSKYIIYTGEKIDISNFREPKDIIRYIRKTKKYKNVSQKDFNTGDTNTSIEKLFDASYFDCLPANILFTTLCRSIGYESRLVVGVSAYNKIDKDKNRKTILSKNKGHAWSEVLINGTWTIFDATPIASDEDNEENEQGDIEEMIENIETEEQISDIDELKIKKPLNETKKSVEIILDNEINHLHFESAFNFVKEDAQNIIHTVKQTLEQRELNKKRQDLSLLKNKKKGGQRTGKLEVNAEVIKQVASGITNIYQRKIKPEKRPEENNDTKLKDIALAIDISGSMGSMTGNWENPSRSDISYLALVLLYYISEELDINFETVVLFGENVYEGSPKDILQEFDFKNEGNTVNDQGIEKSLESIKNTKKGLVIILSDGDGATGQAFFNGKSIGYLEENTNLKIVSYGLGEEASQKLTGNMKDGTIPSVIEYRMQESGMDKSSKGYPLETYKNLVPTLSDHLLKMMSENNVVL